jgi:hypothetical protein
VVTAAVRDWTWLVDVIMLHASWILHAMMHVARVEIFYPWYAARVVVVVAVAVVGKGSLLMRP